IIAGRIREKYYKPVFVLTKGEDGVKGSGRSTEVYSMYEEMCKCQELFTKFGGHPMAAGLSLPEENVELFRKKINRLSPLSEIDKKQKVRIDVPMPMDYVSLDLVHEFGILAPFGKDNTKPVFADKYIRIKRMWIMGKNRNVLKLSLVTEQGKPVSGIYFGDIEAFCAYIEDKFGKPELENALEGKNNDIELSLVYFPKINSFRGVDELQFEIQYYQ
ncbi:MAG: single-stranded-DNA-specific exonuclease RecJ, partial [Agathobacter sp.]|nr:single-stranded-DNA-specific exonuclease RecJ [Agathobacter sp.]